jgi:hypothetical protein
MLAMATIGALLLSSSTIHAASTPEQACQKGRYVAKAKYEACESKATGAFLGGGDNLQLMRATVKCRAKYDAAWVKLQAKAQAASTVETCDADRFVPTGGGVVVDNLTGLQWEQKIIDFGIHLGETTYAWSTGGPSSTAADGPAYTTFLATLNSNGCFAGQCDWRLPTRSELQTIKNHASDQALFGDGINIDWDFWTSTSSAISTHAWVVRHDQSTEPFTTPKFVDLHVRAVRGGL